jgi:hypothetical protein
MLPLQISSAPMLGRRFRGERSVVVREYAVKGTPNTDHEFQKAGASEDERRHSIESCLLRTGASLLSVCFF